MSPAERAEAARTANTLADRLFDAHAVIGAARHQLRGIEEGGAHSVTDEAHDAGRVLRQAASAVHQLASVLAGCLVVAGGDETRTKLRELVASEGAAS